MSISNTNNGTLRTQQKVVFVTIGLVLGLVISSLSYFVFTEIVPSEQETFSKDSLVDTLSFLDDTGALFEQLATEESPSTQYSTSNLLKISETIQTFSTEELVSALRRSASLPYTRGLFPIQEILCEYLVEKSPSEALRSAWLFKEHRKLALLRTVFSFWAVQNLEESIVVATGLGHPYKGIALETILAELDAKDEIPSALKSSVYDEIVKLHSEKMYELEIYESISRDPSTAFNLLLTDDVEDSEQTILLSQAFHEMFQLEGFDAIRKLNLFKYDKDIFNELLLQVVEQDRVGTINFLQNLSFSDQILFMYPLMENWLELDVETALQTVTSLSNPTYRASAYRTLVNLLGHTRPLEVMARLEEIPREYRSSAVFNAINTLGATNPDRVLSLLPSLKSIPGAFNNENERAFVCSWASQSPDKALKWVQENVEPESYQRNRLMNRVLGEFALVDYQKAMDVATKEDPNPSRSELGLASSVIDALVRDGQVDAAIELFDQVPENTRPPIYADVAEKLVIQDRLDDVVSMSESFSATDKVYYFSSIARGLSRTNPSGVITMVTKLPNDRLRADVVNRILSDEWGTERYYTEEQLVTLRSLVTEQYNNRGI